MWNDLLIKLQASKLPRILRTNESHTSILSSYPTECYVIILTSAIVLSAVYLLFDINTETGFNSYCTQLYTDSCNMCVCLHHGWLHYILPCFVWQWDSFCCRPLVRYISNGTGQKRKIRMIKSGCNYTSPTPTPNASTSNRPQNSIRLILWQLTWRNGVKYKNEIISIPVQHCRTLLVWRKLQTCIFPRMH